MQSKRRGLLSQKVILIHDNACTHRVQLILIILTDFCWEQFEQPLYSLDLAPSNYHLFQWLKKEIGRQCFQT